MANHLYYPVILTIVNAGLALTTCGTNKLVTIRLMSFMVTSDITCDHGESKYVGCDLWFRFQACGIDIGSACTCSCSEVLNLLPATTDQLDLAAVPGKYKALSHVVRKNDNKVILRVQFADHDGQTDIKKVRDAFIHLHLNKITDDDEMQTAFEDEIEVDIGTHYTKTIVRPVTSITTGEGMTKYTVTMNYTLELKVTNEGCLTSISIPTTTAPPTPSPTTTEPTTAATSTRYRSTTKKDDDTTSSSTLSGTSWSVTTNASSPVVLVNSSSSATRLHLKSQFMSSTIRSTEEIGQGRTIKLMLEEDTDGSTDIDDVSRRNVQNKCKSVALLLDCDRCSVIALKLEKSYLPIVLMQYRRKRDTSNMFNKINELLLNFFRINPFELTLANGQKIKIIGERAEVPHDIPNYTPATVVFAIISIIFLVAVIVLLVMLIRHRRNCKQANLVVQPVEAVEVEFVEAQEDVMAVSFTMSEVSEDRCQASVIAKMAIQDNPMKVEETKQGPKSTTLKTSISVQTYPPVIKALKDTTATPILKSPQAPTVGLSSATDTNPTINDKSVTPALKVNLINDQPNIANSTIQSVNAPIENSKQGLSSTSESPYQPIKKWP